MRRSASFAAAWSTTSVRRYRRAEQDHARRSSPRHVVSGRPRDIPPGLVPARRPEASRVGSSPQGLNKGMHQAAAVRREPVPDHEELATDRSVERCENSTSCGLLIVPGKRRKQNRVSVMPTTTQSCFQLRADFRIAIHFDCASFCAVRDGTGYWSRRPMIVSHPTTCRHRRRASSLAVSIENSLNA